MIPISSCFWQIFPWMHFLGDDFLDLILDFLSFMMISFFKILSKTFGKLTIYYKKISHRLLFVPFIILTLQWLGRGVQWTLGKINWHCFKATFLFRLKLYCFSYNLFRNILIEKTPKFRDVIIFVRWSKLYISKM